MTFLILTLYFSQDTLFLFILIKSAPEDTFTDLRERERD